MTVQNLHCSELARWPGDPAETLAGLRAAMAPGAELILESTPDGVGGCFHEEWQKAGETGMVRHFFPWWMEAGYIAEPVDETSLQRRRAAIGSAAWADSGADWVPAADSSELSGDWRGRSMPRMRRAASGSGDSVFEPAADRGAAASRSASRRKAAQWGVGGVASAGEGRVPGGGGSGGRRSGGDYSAAQVLELETGLQCAEFAGACGRAGTGESW